MSSGMMFLNCVHYAKQRAMNQIFSAEHVRAALQVEEAEYLGTGSFGEVWRAPFGDGNAAYKFIHAGGYQVGRLEREIDGYRRVDSPHVVRLFSVQETTIGDQRLPTMVFEYVPGCDLESAIARERPPADALRALVLGLLRGIDAMHAAEVLHRDLKPANVALRDGAYLTPVVLDLGFAKLLDVESITLYPSLIGTTLYMAPEQLRQERALRASDLWAVGVIGYEAATGSHPFFAAGERIPMSEAFSRLQNKPTHVANAPADVADVILRCLEYVPYRRGTVARAISDLEEGE